MKKQVILFTTCQSNFDEELKKYIFYPLYNDIKNNDKYDFYVLYNKPKKSDPDLYLDGINVVSFDNEYLLKKYKNLYFGYNWYGSYNTYYMIYEFYLLYKEYDYYWTIEDDVYFTGNWNILFNYYFNNINDLICSYTYFNHPTTIKNWPLNYINKLLGKEFFNDNNIGLAFLPIARLSNNLINTIINSDLYYNCFQELQVGSIVKKYNFNVEYLDVFNHNKILNRYLCGSISYNNKYHKVNIMSYISIKHNIVHPIKHNQYYLLDYFIYQ